MIELMLVIIAGCSLVIAFSVVHWNTKLLERNKFLEKEVKRLEHNK